MSEMEIKCVCDVAEVMVAPYVAMMHTLGKFDPEQNVRVVSDNLAKIAVVAVSKDDLDDDIDTLLRRVYAAALAVIAHDLMSNDSICGRVQDAVDMIRDELTVTVQDLT